MTGRIVLIQCTKTKRDEAAKAKHLYDESALFRKMRDYAEAKTDEWYILSAKYGLVMPDQNIAPYDAFGLSDEQAVSIADWFAYQDAVIEIVAGKAYADVLTPELEKRGCEVHEPCRGMKIGERMQWLDTQTTKADHDTF